MNIAQQYKNVAYLVTNKVNGKQYVGITTRGIRDRWKGHCQPKNTRRWQSALHNAIMAYGKEQFEIRIILVGNDAKYLIHMEPKLIAAYGTRAPNGYNLTDGGEGVAGCEFTPEAKAFRSKQASRANANLNFRLAQRAGVIAMHADPDRKEAWRLKAVAGMRTEESRRKRSEASKIRMADPEHRKRIEASRVVTMAKKRMLNNKRPFDAMAIIGLMGMGV